MSNTEKVKEIEELISQLKSKCRALKLPMFVAVCNEPRDFNEDEPRAQVEEIKNPNYIVEFLPPYQCNKKLVPDYISDGIKAINGFGDIKRNEDIDLDDINATLPESFT